MGIVQKESFWSTIASYLGIGLGYINKGFLFIILLESFQIGLINLLLCLANTFKKFPVFALGFKKPSRQPNSLLY